MKIFYAEADYGDDEIKAVNEVLVNNRLALMNGKNTYELEKKVSSLFRKKHGLMTNSGSSANLIAIKSLRLPLGSKVITPALTFSTTVAPIVQSGLIPLFIDVELSTLQIDTAKLKEIDLENVSAICVPNLIGKLANWEEIYQFSKANSLMIIEDSADTIGYDYDTKIKDFSDVSTTSFYASHVVTGAGFGGMTCFKSIEDYNYAKSLRSWGRRSSQYGETEDYERRFSCQVDGIDYDDKYVFDDLGYNFIPSEISAAFALVQINKLKANIKKRNENVNYLTNKICNSENFQTFKDYANCSSGWLAYPLLLKNKLSNKRKEFQTFLEKNHIQTRTIFTGNIMRQPVAKKFLWDSQGDFEASDEVMRNGLLLACHNRMDKEKNDYMLDKIFEAEKCLI